MRVALFTDGIAPYVLGGMQRHSYFIAKYLALNKIEVDLYHTNQSNLPINELAVFTPEEKKYIRSFVIPFPPPGKLPGHYLRRSYHYSKLIYETYIKQPPVDFIYTKGFTGWYLLKQRKNHQLNTPPIGVKFHGMNMFQKVPNFKSYLEALMFKPPVRFILNNSDYVFSYGGKITDITMRVGVPRSKIIDIPTGITADWLNTPNTVKQPLQFIYIGRYERLKGIEELCEAIKQLNYLPFEFHFVGPIPNEKKINKPNVFYHGSVRDGEQIKKYLDASDVLVCPSYSEGMPNVIIEAMSRGLAIIATDVGATNFLVNDKNGWLIPTCSISLIKSAITSAINCNSSELMQKKIHSFEFIKNNLLWDNIANKLINFLYQATGLEKRE
jgi:glycosyltransferase involved in cell wall biosynthesis